MQAKNRILYQKYPDSLIEIKELFSKLNSLNFNLDDDKSEPYDLFKIILDEISTIHGR